MSNAATPAAGLGQSRHFPRQWYRAAIPAVFAVVAFGLFALRVPAGLWVAVPALCLVLFVCAALHGGVVVTSDGVEWYVLRRRWRYRVVPWSAVLDVRKSLFGLHPIRLVVEHGRYEPWAWGTLRPDRRMDIELWPNGYTGGEELWDVVHQFRSAARARSEVPRK